MKKILGLTLMMAFSSCSNNLPKEINVRAPLEFAKVGYDENEGSYLLVKLQEATIVYPSNPALEFSILPLLTGDHGKKWPLSNVDVKVDLAVDIVWAEFHYALDDTDRDYRILPEEWDNLTIVVPNQIAADEWREIIRSNYRIKKTRN